MYKYSVFKWVELGHFNGFVLTCCKLETLDLMMVILSDCCFSVVAFFMITLV